MTWIIWTCGFPVVMAITFLFLGAVFTFRKVDEYLAIILIVIWLIGMVKFW